MILKTPLLSHLSKALKNKLAQFYNNNNYSNQQQILEHETIL